MITVSRISGFKKVQKMTELKIFICQSLHFLKGMRRSASSQLLKFRVNDVREGKSVENDRHGFSSSRQCLHFQKADIMPVLNCNGYAFWRHINGKSVENDRMRIRPSVIFYTVRYLQLCAYWFFGLNIVFLAPMQPARAGVYERTMYSFKQ